MADSLQHKLERVGGRPRFFLTYDVESDGYVQKVELPFVVGVLADLSGQPHQALRPLRDRKAVEVDRDNFNQVLECAGVRLALRIPNKLADQGGELAIQLNFKSIEDFEPTRVALQIGPLQQLLDMRRDLIHLNSRLEGNDKLAQLLEQILADSKKAEAMRRDLDAPPPAPPLSRLPPGWKESGAFPLFDFSAPGEDSRSAFKEFLDRAVQPGQVSSNDAEKNIRHWIQQIDASLSAQVNEVLHHPDFQKLESTWRGLFYLVRETETCSTLKIRVLNASKADLIHDFADADAIDQSSLFKIFHDDEYDMLGGQPYGMLVGDYEFSHSADDVGLLTKIARLAAQAHAPFVAATSPRMFGMDGFADVAKLTNVAKTFEDAEHGAWNSFSEAPDSCYAALTLPRVLSRLPYGNAYRRVEEFDFEETVDRAACAWMSAAWALAVRVTSSFAATGLLARVRGVEAGGKVEGLPAIALPASDGESDPPMCIEVRLNDRIEWELCALGFQALLPMQDTSAVFMMAQSCRKRRTNAELSSQLHVHLCASRFAQYLKVLTRHGKLNRHQPTKEFEKWLNEWISNYCVQPSDTNDALRGAARPLADARIELRPRDGKPGWLEGVAHLRFNETVFGGEVATSIHWQIGF